MLHGHATALQLGLERAGKTSYKAEDVLHEARGIKDGESKYLNEFASAIKSGDARYVDDSGNIRAGSLDARSDLYARKMRGTANKGFVDGSKSDVTFDWVLGFEKHCEDCPQIAALSPYTKDTLIGYPGDGDTECLGNCTCTLERSDGVKGFPRDNAGSEEESEEAQSPLSKGGLPSSGSSSGAKQDPLSEKLYGDDGPSVTIDCDDAAKIDPSRAKDALSKRLYGDAPPKVKVKCSFIGVAYYAETCDLRTRKAIDDTFGTEMTAQQVGDLAAAIPGSTVTVASSGGEITVDAVKGTLDPFYLKGTGVAEQLSFKKVEDEILAHLDLIAVVDEEPGTATRVFAKMVERMKAAKISRIDGLCVGNYDDPKWNGYYTWARFGFNAKLPDATIEALAKDGLPGVSDMNDLMLKYGDKGADWWCKNGFKMKLTFDLDDKSRSMEVWRQYLTKKGIIV